MTNQDVEVTCFTTRSLALKPASLVRLRCSYCSYLSSLNLLLLSLWLLPINHLVIVLIPHLAGGDY